MAQRESRPPRRSSLVATFKEGLAGESNNLIGDLMKLMPNSLLQNAARHSAGFQGRRSSIINNKDNSTVTVNSFNPTPQIKQVGGASSSIPRPLNFNQPSSSNRAPRSALRKTGTLNGGITKTGKESATRKTGPGIRRRSGSVDSLAMQSMWFKTTPSTNMQTPNNALRSRSRSPFSRPSSMKRWASQESVKNLPASKNLKPPETKDKIQKYAEILLDFLKKRNYPIGQAYTIQNIGKMNIPQNEFFQICKFVIEQIMGNNYFGSNLKTEDLCAKIIEFSTLMKYPGTIKKNDLKTPSLPRYSQINLAFLAWTCCRIESFEEEEEHVLKSKNLVGVVVDPADTELIFESLMNLYFKGLYSQQALEQELEEFQNRLEYQNMMENFPNFPSSIEEIEKLVEEKIAAKEDLFSKPDPALEVCEKLKATNEQLEKMAIKKSEVMALLNKYKNIDSLLKEHEILKSQISQKKVEVEDLKERVASQAFDKETAKKMKDETEILKKQRVALISLTNNLRHTLDIKRKIVKDLETKFYSICGEFACVEDYNILASKFKLDLIYKNPFNELEFKEWLKNSNKIMHKSNKEAHERQHYYQQESEKFKTEVPKLKARLAGRDLELKEIEASTKEMELDNQRQERHWQFELDELVSQINAQSTEISKFEGLVKDASRKMERLERTVEEKEKELSEQKVKFDKEGERAYNLDMDLIQKELDTQVQIATRRVAIWEFFKYVCKQKLNLDIVTDDESDEEK